MDPFTSFALLNDQTNKQIYRQYYTKRGTNLLDEN